MDEFLRLPSVVLWVCADASAAFAGYGDDGDNTRSAFVSGSMRSAKMVWTSFRTLM